MQNSANELTIKLFCHTLTGIVFSPALTETGDEELTDVQYACLRFVNLHREPSIGSVAEGLRISNAASTKLIHRLVLKRLVERREDPEDRRVLQLVLTEAGKTLVEKVQSLQSSRLDRILDRMADSDRKALLQGLKGFLEAALLSPEEVDRVCQRCGWLHLASCPGNLVYQKLTGQEKTTI